MKKQSKTGNMILLDIPWDCRYGREVLRGIYGYAQPHRPWLFTDMQPVPDDKQRKYQMRDAQTVGVISVRHPQPFAALARRYGRAAVIIEDRIPGGKSSGPPYAGVNPKALGEIAVEYFINRGFQYFGLVAPGQIGPSVMFHSLRRGEGFIAALRRRKLTCDVFDPKKQYLRRGKQPLPPVSDSPTLERARRWLMGLPRPLAVFCNDDLAGLCLSELCRRSGIQVPEEVAILGVDDDVFCGMAWPHLSSITVPAEQVGYEAAKLMDAMLAEGKVPMRSVLLPPLEVVTRQSTDVMAIDDGRVVEAVKFIRENAYRGIRVEDVMEETHLPRRTMEKRFRKALGRSPFAEIRRVQIENIKTLLARTDKTLEVIAPECGFIDVSRMGQAFKEVAGTSPGAYRKQFRSR